MRKLIELPGEGHWVRLSQINEICVWPGTSDLNLWIGSNPDQTIIDCASNTVALEVAKNIRDACEKDAEGATGGRELEDYMRWLSSRAGA